MKKLLYAAFAVTAGLMVSATSASADTIHLSAILTPGEETPAALLSGAAGSVEVDIDTVTKVLSVELRVFNLPTGTTAGHIHIGPKGVGGPVVLDFPIPTGITGDLGLTFTIGAAQFRARPEIGIVTIDDAIQSIANGNSYANIHTTTNPGGEVRGQLVLKK